MKNLTYSLRQITFSFSALSMISILGLLSPLPTLAASKTYKGTSSNVTASCVPVDEESVGNYSIDGRSSSTTTANVVGVAYFDNDPNSAQVINDSSSSPDGDLIFNGSGYNYGFLAINFGAAIVATGNAADGSPVIELPDLFDNPDAAFGYTVNCGPPS